jgi:hypothetical protein
VDALEGKGERERERKGEMDEECLPQTNDVPQAPNHRLRHPFCLFTADLNPCCNQNPTHYTRLRRPRPSQTINHPFHVSVNVQRVDASTNHHLFSTACGGVIPLGVIGSAMCATAGVRHAYIRSAHERNDELSLSTKNGMSKIWGKCGLNKVFSDIRGK